MKKFALWILTGCIVSTYNVQAASITNADFSRCDYSGWTTESVPGPATSNDFSIVSRPDGCEAHIEIDSSSAFINLLYQPVGFSLFGTDPLVLHYRFSVDSTLANQPSLSADYFAMGFNDGSGQLFNAEGEVGTLFGTPDINGAANYQGTFLLADSFANQTGWSLEVQLLSNFDGAAAWMDIQQLSIEPFRPASVSATSTALLAIMSFGLLGRARRTTKEIR